MTTFSIVELIRRQFGHSAAEAYKKQMHVLSQMQGNATSRLNTPVWDTLEISAGQVETTGEVYSSYTFPDVLMLEVARSKNIVETKIAGRDGTVKELIGMNDYEISIKGFLINYDDEEWPKQDVMALRHILELPTSLNICSPYLDTFNVDMIAVKDFKFPLLEGYSHVQPFEIQAVADKYYSPIII